MALTSQPRHSRIYQEGLEGKRLDHSTLKNVLFQRLSELGPPKIRASVSLFQSSVQSSWILNHRQTHQDFEGYYCPSQMDITGAPSYVKTLMPSLGSPSSSRRRCIRFFVEPAQAEPVLKTSHKKQVSRLARLVTSL